MEKKTYYCDRCGTEVIYPLSTRYKLLLLKRKNILITFDKHKDDYLDLCQECYTSLEHWMNIGSKNKEE